MTSPRARKPGGRPERSLRIDGPRLGRVVAAVAGVVKVDFEGNLAGPLVARVASVLDDQSLAHAAKTSQGAVLLFDAGDPRRPILLALVRSETPMIDAVLAGTLPSGDRSARVDGKRVEIEGHDEVTIRCGRASLSLRRDGKVTLRGVTVVTEADSVQKIRGRRVQVN